VNLIATGSGKKDASGFATDGDINARGTQISGQNVTLNAARHQSPKRPGHEPTCEPQQ
jgi:filamentous hemagglutinin